MSEGCLLRYSISSYGFHLNGDRRRLLGIVHLIIHAKNIPTPGANGDEDDDDGFEVIKKIIFSQEFL